MPTITIICSGNDPGGRSATAEQLFRKREEAANLQPRFEVRSRAIGNPLRGGVKLTQADVDQSDILVVMEKTHELLVLGYFLNAAGKIALYHELGTQNDQGVGIREDITKTGDITEELDLGVWKNICKRFPRQKPETNS